MSDMLFNIMLFPLYFLPVLCVFRLIGKKDTVLLWLFFFVSSLFYVFFKNALPYLLLLMLVLGVIRFFGRHLVIFGKRRFFKKHMIVVYVDTLNSELILSDGSGMYSQFVLEPRFYKQGSIVRLDKSLGRF